MYTLNYTKLTTRTLTTSTPLYILQQQENSFTHRRMSDPNQAWNHFMRGSFKSKGIRKSRSETERVDTIGSDGTTEVEASNVEDGK